MLDRRTTRQHSCPKFFRYSIPRKGRLTLGICSPVKGCGLPGGRHPEGPGESDTKSVLLISSFNTLYFQSVALKPLTDRVLVQIGPANATPFNFYQYLTRPKLRDGHILYSNVFGAVESSCSHRSHIESVKSEMVLRLHREEMISASSFTTYRLALLCLPRLPAGHDDGDRLPHLC